MSVVQLAPKPAAFAIQDLVAADDDPIDADAPQLADELIADLRRLPHARQPEILRRHDAQDSVDHRAVMDGRPAHRTVLLIVRPERYLDDAHRLHSQPAVDLRY